MFGDNVTASLLASPLKFLVPRQRLVETVGDRSIDPPVPVRVVEQEDRLIVLGLDSSTWWKKINADEPTTVVTRRGNDRRTHTAVTLSGDALDVAMVTYLQRFPGQWRELGVPPEGTADDVKTAARSMAVIALSPQ